MLAWVDRSKIPKDIDFYEIYLEVRKLAKYLKDDIMDGEYELVMMEIDSRYSGITIPLTFTVGMPNFQFGEIREAGFEYQRVLTTLSCSWKFFPVLRDEYVVEAKNNSDFSLLLQSGKLDSLAESGYITGYIDRITPLACRVIPLPGDSNESFNYVWNHKEKGSTISFIHLIMGEMNPDTEPVSGMTVLTENEDTVVLFAIFEKDTSWEKN